MAGSFRSELTKKSSERIEFYEVSFDASRIKNAQDEQPFVDYMRALLSGRDPDLIVPVGAPAAFFMQRQRANLFPKTPMVIIGANQRRIPAATLTENDTGVLLNDDITQFLKNILRVRPDTKHVAIVIGNSPVERYWASELVREFQPAPDGLKVETFNDLTFDEMLKRSATMPANSAILWFLLSVDAAGVPYVQDEALDKMREVANAPIFGVGDYQLGREIVGGPLIQTYALGQQAADVAVRIFKGAKLASIRPQYMTLGTPTYDWRELRRWNISESQLPPNSIVQFREPSIWHQYRWEIVGIAAVLLAQAAVIIGLVVERRRRLAAEQELRQRLLEVLHLNRTAVAGALSASFAHELGQPLGAIQSYADAAILYLDQSPPNLEKIRTILTNILKDDLRAADIVTNLRGLMKKRGGVETQDLDLNDIIADTVEIVAAEALRIGVDLDVYRPNGPLLVRADRIQLQQALVNLAINGIDAMRDCHDGKRRLGISAALVNDSSIEVSVADTGTGIPPDKLNTIFDTFYTTKGDGTGLGLTITRTIVQALGGKVWAENRPGGGSLFRFILPLSKTAQAPRAS